MGDSRFVFQLAYFVFGITTHSHLSETVEISYLSVRPPKNITCFSGTFFEKMMREGGFLFYFFLLINMFGMNICSDFKHIFEFFSLHTYTNPYIQCLLHDNARIFTDLIAGIFK